MKTCPVKGCNVREGMCIHKKIMVAAVISMLAIIAIVYYSRSHKSEEKLSMTNVESTSGDKGVMMAGVGSYEVYDASKIARAATGKVVLFFRAVWCPTCHALDADIHAHLNNIPKGVTILDVDYDHSDALKQKYGITSQHTLVEVDKDGNQINKWSGSPTLADVIGHIK